MANTTNADIYQFQIVLKNVSPPIWRRIQVPDYFDFDRLHMAIQLAMGWKTEHPYQFLMNGRTVSHICDAECSCCKECNKKFIRDYFKYPDQKGLYIYDLHDRWEHIVILEEICCEVPGEKYPECLDGERACPPENCGGPNGYNNLLDILRNPHHRLRRGKLAWLRDTFGPSYHSEKFSPRHIFDMWHGPDYTDLMPKFNSGFNLASLTTQNVYQFKITLKHVSPPVWRRITIPENFTFEEFHLAIQQAMGWLNNHCYEFKVNGETISQDFQDAYSLIEKDALVGNTFIKDYFKATDQKSIYEYDFSDSWEHIVVLEQICVADKKEKFPKCLDGQRACPPEDVGGPNGYKNLLQALNNPSHREHRDKMAWLKIRKEYENFQPDTFFAAHVFDGWKKKKASKTVEEPVYQFRVTLIGVEPKIWRRIQVPSNFTFGELHLAIQLSMGWLCYHYYQFEIDGHVFDSDNCGHKASIREYFCRPKHEAIYEYDFGDMWTHAVVFEKSAPAKAGETYPKCVAGQRACPPEDCGGPTGYRRLLKILKTPSHKEHIEMKSWLSNLKEYKSFHPEKFTPDHVFDKWNKIRKLVLRDQC